MSHYFRKAIYAVERVLPHVHFPVYGRPHTAKNTLVDFDGDLINMGTSRLRMFIEKGIKCVTCQLQGNFFAKERDRYGTNVNSRFHLNLYGFKNGFEVMLTKDHIFPEHAGGSNSLNNLQTMCADCNHKKDGLLPFSFEEAVAKNLVTDFAISNRIPNVAVLKTS